jgi:Leucine-rich repeat (LRR) protein
MRATFWKDHDNVLDLLANGLEQNNSLQLLDLTYNHLNDDDLRLLLSCLPKCPNLTDIDVSSNAITKLDIFWKSPVGSFESCSCHSYQNGVISPTGSLRNRRTKTTINRRVLI